MRGLYRTLGVRPDGRSAGFFAADVERIAWCVAATWRLAAALPQAAHDVKLLQGSFTHTIRGAQVVLAALQCAWSAGICLVLVSWITMLALTGSERRPRVPPDVPERAG